MIPSKLIRHLNTKHAVHADENKNYFQRLLSQNKKQECFMKLSFKASEKAVQASYHVAKLIARKKKPKTIGESLLKPECLDRLMLGPKEVTELRKVLLSAYTIKRRIDNMSNAIQTLLYLRSFVLRFFDFTFELTVNKFL